MNSLRNMPRELYHPNAYLTAIRNIRLGLRARTAVLNVLERLSGDGKTVAKEATVPYAVAMHHLKLLQTEGIVHRQGAKPYTWVLTGLGQKRLGNSS